MKLEEKERVESRKRTRKTKGMPEEEGDGTKTGEIFPTPPFSSTSKHGHVTKDDLPKLHSLKKKCK